MSGFSGRATRLLARSLANRGEEFWPPIYQANYQQVGAFIVQYEAATEESTIDDILRTDEIGNPTVIPLAEEVIARRLRP